jgi:hypothetical protein
MAVAQMRQSHLCCKHSMRRRKTMFQSTKEKSRVVKTRLPEKCPTYLKALVKDGTFSVCFSRGNPRRSSIVASNQETTKVPGSYLEYIG